MAISSTALGSSSTTSTVRVWSWFSGKPRSLSAFFSAERPTGFSRRAAAPPGKAMGPWGAPEMTTTGTLPRVACSRMPARKAQPSVPGSWASTVMRSRSWWGAIARPCSAPEARSTAKPSACRRLRTRSAASSSSSTTSATRSLTSGVGAAAEAAPTPEVNERVALVVEDDDDAADLVRNLLQAEGFAVLRASGAEQGLAMAPHQDLDLITVDAQLPGTDGWAFLAGIREHATLGKVPVVVISGAPQGPIALPGGAAALLEKPVGRSALKKALSDLGFPENQDQTRTVLVVDDDPKAVELIAMNLPSPAYATVRAYSGREAILLAHRVRPDLILLDLMMPDVTGFNVVQALQDDPSTASIPILVITAREITELDRQVLNVDPGHVVRIIEKAGFNSSDFMAEVRHALPQT